VARCSQLAEGRNSRSLLDELHTQLTSFAELGNSQALLRLGVSYLLHDRIQTLYPELYLADKQELQNRAFAWFSKAAMLDNPYAQALLARFYLDYDSTRYDYDQGVKLVEQAQAITGRDYRYLLEGDAGVE